MVFVKRQYGVYKKEIQTLLRRRLQVKKRLRHHRSKFKEFEDELIDLDSQVRYLEAII